MIKEIEIKNFKSLRDVRIGMRGLNLLFGMNGMGKSSVLQALLLLRQSYFKNDQLNLNTLHINGRLTELGTAKEIIYQNSEEDMIRFCVSGTGGELSVAYQYVDEGSSRGTMEADLDVDLKGDIFSEALFQSDRLYYIGADHLRPMRDYDATEITYGINFLGKRGELAVPYLAAYGEKVHVAKALCLDDAKSDRLIDQTSEWMKSISPGIRLEATFSGISEAKAVLLAKYEGKKLNTEGFSPVNIGFGVPHVLPVIVVLLNANPGDVVLIENPESHLHPRGQSRLAELLSRAAANGVQILCESHSDHILNGVRVAVKKSIISYRELKLTYFDKTEEQDSYATEVYMDCRGELSEYPKGLLDEWGLSMTELILG